MIKEITKYDIPVNYIIEAKKSGLVFCNNTIMYGIYNNDVMVGFCGMLLNKKKATFKNIFVLQEFRGNGYFKNLLTYMIVLCQQMGIKVIEATCTKMSFNEFIKRGFVPIKKYKLYTKVRHENI